MVTEMLDAERTYLPQFANKKLRATPGISIPSDLVRQEVPLDPALAIANRFGKLAQA
jgi:alpha-galactosidase